MKAKPLALAVAQARPDLPRYEVQAAQVKSLWNPVADIEVRKPEYVQPVHMVELLRIEGEDFILRPGLRIVDGIARRVVETPDYIHVFSVKANFATGEVVGHLQSFEYGSHEYVYMKGEWAITTYHTNLSRRS